MIEPKNLPNREDAIGTRGAPAERILEAARDYIAKHESGQHVEPRALEWARFMVKVNRCN